jgi:hypothetical protein
VANSLLLCVLAVFQLHDSEYGVGGHCGLRKLADAGFGNDHLTSLFKVICSAMQERTLEQSFIRSACIATPTGNGWGP